MNRLAHLLTRPEREVVTGMVAGLTDPEIAEVMRCPVKSIAVYRHRAKKKLGARTIYHTTVLWMENEDPTLLKRAKWSVADLVRAVCLMAEEQLEGR